MSYKANVSTEVSLVALNSKCTRPLTIQNSQGLRPEGHKRPWRRRAPRRSSVRIYCRWRCLAGKRDHRWDRRRAPGRWCWYAFARIVNHAVVRVFNLVLGLVDLGQLVQVIDGVVVHLILAVFGGHITRRSTDASMSGRRALVRSLTSLRRNRPGIRTVLGFRGDERENRAGLALAAWPVGSVRMCVRMRFSWGGDTEDC